MTVSVTMTQTRLGEDGTLWTAGTTHDATDDFARYLITYNYATGTLPYPLQSLPLMHLTATAAEIAATSGQAGVVYEQRDAGRAQFMWVNGRMRSLGAAPLDAVSPKAHISRVLAGAEAARRVRPDATYATERWCTPAGAGAHNGTSLANAWSLSELNTALATLTGAHVYLVGTFEPAAYNSAGPLVGPVVGDSVRLDLATHGAVLRGYSGASWTASGTNGEYWTTASNQQRNFRLTENGLRMQGTCPSDCGAAMDTTALDIDADTITLEVYRELAVDDVIAWISGTANGLSPGTTYYVRTASAVSSGTQTITLSTTIGGAAVNITGTTAGRMFSLVGGRDGDPVPGSLEPGQFAWAPHEARIYMKPTSGVPGDNVYTWWQTGTNPKFIVVRDAAGACNACEIIGGDLYGAPVYGIELGSSTASSTYCTNPKVYGVKVHACESGIVATGCTGADLQWNEVYDLTDHAIGSKNGDTAEPGMRIRNNWARDVARQPWDSGDCQALVTNPASDYAEMSGNVVQRIGHRRDLTTYPLGLNDTINTGAAVIDSSSYVRVTGNYFEECYGEVFEVGPNDVQAVRYTYIAGNVIDQRDRLAETEDVFQSALSPCGTKLQVTSTATAGYDSDYTNLVEGNLFMVGAQLEHEVTTFPIGALIGIRQSQTGTACKAQVKARDNVVIFVDPAAYAVVHYIAKNGTGADTVTGIDSDWNTYYAAGPNVAGARIVNSTAAGPHTPTTEVALSAITAGWTSPDGTVSDKHSTVWTAAEFESEFAEHPTVRRCLLG